MQKKVSRIQVPNEIIVDRSFSHDSFGLYVALKKFSYNNKVKVPVNKLKEELRWKDNRKLKNHLKILYEYDLIDKEIERLDVYRAIELEITKLRDEEWFTQVDKATLNKIRGCTEKVLVSGQEGDRDVYMTSLRLFYYYEKNYNEKYLRAFPSYEQINKDTRINPSYIKAINNLFHKNGIVEVFLGSFHNKLLENGDTEIRREVNSYIPLCNRVV